MSDTEIQNDAVVEETPVQEINADPAEANVCDSCQ